MGAQERLVVGRARRQSVAPAECLEVGGQLFGEGPRSEMAVQQVERPAALPIMVQLEGHSHLVADF